MNVAQQFANGIIIGHAYALVAVGWTLLLGAARLVNFGHGQMYMMGAFVAWWLMSATGLPYAAAVPLAVLVGALLGALMQRLFLRLTLSQDLVNLMIATLGFGQILQGAAGLAFGAKPERLTSPLQAITLGGARVSCSAQDVLLVGATIVVFLGLHWVLRRSRFGAAVRMVAEDPPLAALYGLRVAPVYLAIFAFEGAAVAFAATLVAPRTPILTSIGFEQVVMTFVVVVLGGIGSVGGSYVAGLLLGLYTAFFSALVSPAYTTASVFALLIVVMVVRPGKLAASGGFAR
ncbi:MAG: branched-chain amino acid ABC transporter permease [Acidibrevibacterium sp.]|jgi:branched-chain amino acid transport system permease protein|uniref:branched-chain amino acid ABC transporter permease n=1 Tax=Acidibrevibacterium fodinaquatile TaxID=1969806 RepID=UPI000E0DE0ED|nr:branched-chain amino acid ABC transporter permease [Acidibrevibacterium fodinaquatile]MCA7118430.1 branched-chain amino acid ABC transporter permease [Acidibrevibacterium fodinaquatile]